MRTIKYRAWNKTANGMLEWYFIKDKPLSELVDKPHLELMQFTGLLDKLGKEIYEGDIVEWKYLQTWHKNEVRFVGGGFVVTTSGFKDDLNEPQDLSLVSILNCEIIGNIYENKELTK